MGLMLHVISSGSMLHVLKSHSDIYFSVRGEACLQFVLKKGDVIERGPSREGA